MANIQKEKEQAYYTGLLAKYTAKILLRFNLKFRSFLNHLKKQMVLEAKNLHPEYSNIQLSIRTGIDRRQIGEYLNQKPDDLSNQIEKDQIVMNRLLEYCQNKKTDKIHKTRGLHSFKRICSFTASGASTNEAIATELKRRGWLEDHGDHYKISEKVKSGLDEVERQKLNKVVESLKSINRIISLSDEIDLPALSKEEDQLKILQNLHPALFSAILSVQEYTFHQMGQIISNKNSCDCE